jgi:hypothetical protein
VRVGKETYRRHFGRDPRGMWLPECAYRPSYNWSSPIKEYPKTFMRRGVEEFLFKYDIQYFIVDKHLILGGKNRGVYIDRYESLKQLWQQFEKTGRRGRGERPLDLPALTWVLQRTGGWRGLRTAEEFRLQSGAANGAIRATGDTWNFTRSFFPGGHRYGGDSAKADLVTNRNIRQRKSKKLSKTRPVTLSSPPELYREEYEETANRCPDRALRYRTLRTLVVRRPALARESFAENQRKS